MRLFIAAAAALMAFCCVPALGQSTYSVVATCGTPPAAFPAGAVRTATMDTTGRVCGTATVSGAGDATAANQVLQIAQETAFNAALGAMADAACATDNGTCSTIALIKRTNQRLTTVNTTLGAAPMQSTGGTVGLVANAANNVYVGNVNTQSGKTSYRMSAAGTIDAAGILVQLQGSATRTIRITKIRISGALTTGAVGRIMVMRRSAAATGGTPGSVPPQPLDTGNAAATLVATQYLTVPTGGTLVGRLENDYVLWGAMTALGNLVEWTYGTANAQPILIRGTSEYITIETSTFASYAGAVYSVTVEFTEEA